MPSTTIAELTAAASMVVAAGAVVTAVVAFAATRNLRLSIGVLLEMLTAAGLLRLVAATTLVPVLTAAGIIVVRRVATRGLAYPASGRDPSPG